MRSDGYKFGQKNNWRRWWWAQIAARLDVPRHRAVVLYMPGREDLDRKEATQRGFDGRRLVAVDRDKASVLGVRRAGGTSMRCDAIEAVQFWGAPSIDVIAYDFCCGLEANVWDLCFEIGYSTSIRPGTVIAVNLLRGRDIFSSRLRERAQELVGKHRGRIFLYESARLFFRNQARIGMFLYGSSNDLPREEDLLPSRDAYFEVDSLRDFYIKWANHELLDILSDALDDDEAAIMEMTEALLEDSAPRTREQADLLAELVGRTNAIRDAQMDYIRETIAANESKTDAYIWAATIELFNAAFHSYRSGGLVMDSVICSVPRRDDWNEETRLSGAICRRRTGHSARIVAACKATLSRRVGGLA